VISQTKLVYLEYQQRPRFSKIFQLVKVVTNISIPDSINIIKQFSVKGISVGCLFGPEVLKVIC